MEKDNSFTNHKTQQPIEKIPIPPISEEKKKETISLAIDSKVLDNIRKSANEEGISVNAFVDSILRNWTNFYRYFKENQAVALTAKNFQAHLEHIDEEVFINEFKDNALNLVPAILAERKIELTLDDLIEYEYKSFGVLGGAFLSVNSYTNEEGYRCIMFRHPHGIKWSRIIAKAISYELKEFFGYHASDEAKPNMVVVKILEKM